MALCKMFLYSVLEKLSRRRRKGPIRINKPTDGTRSATHNASEGWFRSKGQGVHFSGSPDQQFRFDSSEINEHWPRNREHVKDFMRMIETKVFTKCWGFLSRTEAC